MPILLRDHRKSSQKPSKTNKIRLGGDGDFKKSHFGLQMVFCIHFCLRVEAWSANFCSFRQEEGGFKWNSFCSFRSGLLQTFVMAPYPRCSRFSSDVDIWSRVHQNFFSHQTNMTISNSFPHTSLWRFWSSNVSPQLCEASSVVERAKKQDRVCIFFTTLLWHLHSQLTLEIIDYKNGHVCNQLLLWSCCNQLFLALTDSVSVKVKL